MRHLWKNRGFEMKDFYQMNERFEIWYQPQIGFMISWGKDFRKRPYVALELPFFTIQIFFEKQLKHK